MLTDLRHMSQKVEFQSKSPGRPAHAGKTSEVVLEG